MRKDIPELQPALHSRRREGPIFRILVTGSTGFIGKVVVEKLLKRGESVIGFSKSLGNDVMDYYQLKDAMSGCDRVIHLAAKVSFNQKDSEEVSQINIMGTGNIMRAALDNGIKKLVFVSSAITAGISSNKDLLINESYMILPNNDLKTADRYTYSKIAGEQIVLLGTVPVTIVNPSTVIMPSIVKDVQKMRIPLAPPGGTNVIDVRDVADGIIAALDIGKDKERYLLSNFNITYKDLFEKIIHRKALTLPQWSRKILQHIAKRSKSDFLSPFTVANSFHYKYYSNSKARHELGWIPKFSLEETINEYSRG